MLLKKDDHSTDVAIWQGFLISQKFDVKADSFFGPKTEAATKGFQKAHGLRPDGVVGPNTIKAAEAFGFKGFGAAVVSATSPTWYVAQSLETLRLQLNALFPNRSKASDGGIGDERHQSSNSDHNPWVKDKNGRPVVTARDFTHDPANGLDCSKLAAALVSQKDPRIKYIIWNRQICSSEVSPWKWRPYKGSNAHTKHLHLSVNAAEKLFNDQTQWDLTGV